MLTGVRVTATKVRSLYLPPNKELSMYVIYSEAATLTYVTASLELAQNVIQEHGGWFKWVSVI